MGRARASLSEGYRNTCWFGDALVAGRGARIDVSVSVSSVSNRIDGTYALLGMRD